MWIVVCCGGIRLDQNPGCCEHQHEGQPSELISHDIPSRMCAGSRRFARAESNTGWQGEPAEWCAWQESNLLPFGPEPNALSGELQARERFSLDCGVRGQ